ncbi:tripartite tricarboxylate transporter TctB family protein [Salinarimonas sp.]|uniref:tripartite tricarboxylate transporter TctB family protein n=1 Tax=Salinarimonas sp. TaxID=2766526 RepID=UPI0032D974FE
MPTVPTPDRNEGGVATPALATEVARLVSYLAIVAVAAVLFVDAGALPSSRWEPLGAGAFPRLVMGLLVVLGLIAAVDGVVRIARERRRRAASGEATASFGATVGGFLVRRRLVIGAFAAFGVYLGVLRTLGFEIATFLFLVVVMALVAPREKRGAKGLALMVVVALVFSFGLDFLFDRVFNVFLPRGRILG